MAFAHFTATVKYERIGSHLLVWLQELKSWMLLDLEEMSQMTGKTQDEIVASLCRKSEDN